MREIVIKYPREVAELLAYEGFDPGMEAGLLADLRAGQVPTLWDGDDFLYLVPFSLAEDRYCEAQARRQWAAGKYRRRR